MKVSLYHLIYNQTIQTFDHSFKELYYKKYNFNNYAEIIF
jgi:hypothetical protein